MKISLESIKAWILDQNKPFSLDPDQVYVNNKTKLNLTCELGHSFQMRWNDIQQGHGCPYCKHNPPTSIASINLWLTQNTSIELLPGQNYKNDQTKMTWRCKHNHTWSTSWNHIRHSYGCPHCAKVFPWSITAIKEWLESNHRTITLIPEQIYKNRDTPLFWRCTQGHIWKTSLGHILGDCGCPHCVGLARKTIKDLEEWLESKKKPFHLVPNQIYQNSIIKLRWECDQGHIWKATWHDIQAGSECPHCLHKTETRVGQILKELFPGDGRVLSQYPIPCSLDVRPLGKIYVDFYIPELNLLIEYHGIQHYIFPNFFHKTLEKFEYQIKRDSWLRAYCSKQEINLLEISYQVVDLRQFLETYFHRRMNDL
jgi:hypothetical protein